VRSQHRAEPVGRLRTLGVERFGVGGQYRAVQPHVHHREVVGGDLDAQRPPGGTDDADQLARPAAGGRRLVQLLDHALVQQPLHHLGHGGRADVQLPRDVRAGHRPAPAQQCQDRDPGQVPAA